MYCGESVCCGGGGGGGGEKKKSFLCVLCRVHVCVCGGMEREGERKREWRYALCQHTGTERTAGHLHLDTTGRWAGRADPNTITSSSLC